MAEAAGCRPRQLSLTLVDALLCVPLPFHMDAQQRVPAAHYMGAFHLSLVIRH